MSIRSIALQPMAEPRQFGDPTQTILTRAEATVDFLEASSTFSLDVFYMTAYPDYWWFLMQPCWWVGSMTRQLPYLEVFQCKVTNFDSQSGRRCVIHLSDIWGLSWVKKENKTFIIANTVKADRVGRVDLLSLKVNSFSDALQNTTSSFLLRGGALYLKVWQNAWMDQLNPDGLQKNLVVLR